MARTTRIDEAALAAVLRAQYNVIAREQASACGMSRDALAHRLRPDGPWRPLLPGTYLAITGTPTTVQKDMAALVYAGPASVLTGAAALRGQGLIKSAPGKLDVLIPANARRRSVNFAAVRRTTQMPAPVVTIGGLRYAPPARAIADAARVSADLPAVRALVAGAVQRGHCAPHQLARELTSGPVSGSALLRRVLAEVAAGARSVVEAEFADLIRLSRLPAPVLNARLRAADGAFIAVVDAWWPDAGVAAEVDSREWHLSPADWERTMRRHAEMTGHGILVLHFTPRQIRSEPARVLSSLADALTSGRARPPLAVEVRPAS